tara:strand:- start:56 stop:3061 length:3006 start_codon:yes stop_codon:yes gene_type:complete
VQWSFEFLPYPDIVDTPDWLAPVSGDYNMQVIAIVEALGYDVAGSDHMLIALNDDEIIGLAQGSSFSDFWIYNMSLFSNENNFEFRFLFYDNNSQRILPVNESHMFVSQSQIGSPTQPLQLKAGRIIIDISLQNLASIDIISKNWEYPEIIRFRASDIGTVNSLNSSKDITLMIDNDLPQLTLEAQIINEGGLFNPIPLINYIYDNGTAFDSIDVTVSSGPNYNAQIINDTLYVDAPEDENWNGIELVNFEVTDAHPYDVKTLESQIEFIILPINDAPIIMSIENQSIYEDSVGVFSFDVSDIDTGTVLILTAFSDTSAVSVTTNSEAFFITVTPDEDWNGVSQITVIVSDGMLTDSTNFTLIVMNDGDIPYAVLQDDDIFSMQGQDILVDGSSSYDIDNDSLVYHWTVGGIINDTVTTIIPYLSFQTPEVSLPSVFAIKLWVTNTKGLQSDPATLLLNVGALEVNDILPSFEDLIIEEGDDVPISVNMPEYFEVDSISINYSSAFSGFISSPMLDDGSRSSSSYSFDIPYYLTSLEGLVYFIYAEDADGNKIITDTTSITISYLNNEVISTMDHSPFQDGFPRYSWRIISVPTIPSNNHIEGIFNESFSGPPNEARWLIYDWDYQSNEWIVPDSTIAGRAYWLKQIKLNDVSFSIPSGRTAKLTGETIRIEPGWNLISSPYLFPVHVDIDTSKFSELFSYGVDTLEGWVDTVITKMKPWDGYAIYSNLTDSDSIRLTPLAQNQRSTNRSVSYDGWRLKVNVINEKYFDGRNIFGMSSKASNGVDILDCPEPPTRDKYVSLHSTTIAGKKITKDFRFLSDSLQTWDLVLDINNKEGFADIAIKSEGNLNNNVLWLIDMQNAKVLKIGEEEHSNYSISLKSDHSINKFKLIYGRNHEASEIIDKIISNIPREFSLGHNYPNPFNPSTTIPFTISDPGEVMINIYDLQGRIVKQLFNGYLGTGSYSKVWDGTNSLGVSVSSGLYYYGFNTRSFNNYRKMILIK